jgi:osmotically-inducible protein OsmY
MKAKESELNIADKRLRHAVVSQLDYEPQVTSTDIGVAVSDGVVTLSGFINSYAEKIAAEKSVQRVYGVRAIANDLQVKPVIARTDTDIAKTIVDTYQHNLSVPATKIKVTVKDGYVTLDGKVNWQYQRDAAEKAIRNLTGIKGISNHLAINPQVSTTEVKTKIEEALRRNAEIDARRIFVETHGHSVTLTGNVRSWAEKKHAEYAAWGAPGVIEVINLINVIP